MWKRAAYAAYSQKELSRIARSFKVIRWLAPLAFLFLAFFVLPNFLGEEIIYLQIGFIIICVIDYFLFDHIYKNARDELKERFGERV